LHKGSNVARLDNLKDSEVLALEAFVKVYPRHWQNKARVIIAEGSGDHRAALTEIFKRHADYIDRITANEIKRAADEIRQNRGAS
jgi:hypothetical protein